MSTLAANRGWLAVFSKGGALLVDYSAIDVPEMPVLSEAGLADGYGMLRQVEYQAHRWMVLAWNATTPEGQVSDYTTSPATRRGSAVPIMNLPDLTWAPAIVPLFRWNLLPRDLNP